ncbi:MAG: hypothetical protein AAGJ37_05770 [Pseudomonadota bacterium]
MTEVALGLSMAFFALLVVALVSMGLRPVTVVQDNHNNQSTSHIPSYDININKNQQDSKGEALKLFFYANATFYDSELNEVSHQQLNQTSRSVLAISDTMNVKEFITLQTDTQGLDVEFTIMNEEWKAYFLSQGLL